jgi:hypothetical protein
MHAERNVPAGAVTVPLGGSGNYRALIDAEDAAVVVQFRWYRQAGYAYTPLMREGRQINLRMHRMLMGLGPGDDLEVDHINFDRLDNRRCNLRVVTSQQNDQNRRSCSGSSSRFRGVSRDPRRPRWRAIVGLNGKQINCGSYDDELDAARAAEAGRRAHLPFSLPELQLEPVPPCPCKTCSPGQLPGRLGSLRKAA